LQKARGAGCAKLWKNTALSGVERYDLVRERLPPPKFTPGTLALPAKGMMWDNNIDQDREWNLFRTVGNGSRYKLIEWRANRPYFVINPARLPATADGASSSPPKESVVLAAGLHFQGKKKQNIHHYTTWDKTWADGCRCSTSACTNCLTTKR
jgi:hypothetical protein